MFPRLLRLWFRRFPKDALLKSTMSFRSLIPVLPVLPLFAVAGNVSAQPSLPEPSATDPYRFSESLLRGSAERLNLDGANHRLWYRAFGHMLSQGGNDSAGAAGRSGAFDADSYGFSIGLEQRLNRLFMVGGGVGGNWTNTDKTASGRSDVAALFISGYGRFDCRQAYVSLEAGYGWNDHTSTRQGEGGNWRAERSATQFHLRGECGVWWESGFSRFEPYLALCYVALDEPAYGETGPSGEEEPPYGARSDSKTTFLSGLRYSWRQAGPLARVEPIMYGGWVHEFEANDLFSVGTFADAPTVYRVPGFQPRQDRFFIGGGIGSSMRKRLDLYFRYTAEIANGYSTHTLLGGMNWNY